MFDSELLYRWANLETIEWRWPACTLPSSLRYVTVGSLGFSRSCSTISSILFSWQKISTRCWATTASVAPSDPPPPPSPQSNSSWEQKRVRMTEGMGHLWNQIQVNGWITEYNKHPYRISSSYISLCKIKKLSGSNTWSTEDVRKRTWRVISHLFESR